MRRSRPRRGRGAISLVFDTCRKEKRSAFIPFLVAGDPHLDRTPELLAALVRGGSDIIELGVPFSDPMADGPPNQRGYHRALEAGTTLGKILDLVKRHRDALGVPIVLFTYCNPIFRRGLERFAEEAASAGVDGVLFVDLPPEESENEVTPVLQSHGIDQVFLLAPTSTTERIRKAARLSSGFLYYVSRTGVTGEQDQLATDLTSELRSVRRKVKLPLAVGFGISTPEQVASVAGAADAVVVGSHLVSLVAEYVDEPDVCQRLEERVRELTEPLRAKSRRQR
jgi:tryptophan synthase alpha chain